MDQRACELATAEADCRRAINMATKDMNEALARERKAKEDTERQQEQDDNFTEISNHVFGDMLTENPDIAQSAFGPHRVITDRWKGMSPAQLAEIRRIQQAQIEEKQVDNIISYNKVKDILSVKVLIDVIMAPHVSFSCGLGYMLWTKEYIKKKEVMIRFNSRKEKQ